MITHEYWLRLGEGAGRDAGVRDGDVNLIMTPWYYMDAGWNFLLCCVAGIPLVILPRFSASTFWRSVTDNGATFFYCLGTMPIVLLKQPENPALERGHKVRAVLCSAIPPKLHATIEARFGCSWREAYSTTEIGPACLAVPLEDDLSVGSGAMGRPAAGCSARVVDSTGRDVARGEVGELLMRGPGMMLGYWRNPEATASWLVDGWAHTGDLVFEDERGYFHIVGRLKEMIRRGGENIAAAEVEAVLCEHPGVRGAACVPVLDEIRGEEVKAFVTLQPGGTPESVTPETLLAFCRSKLARFKVPRFVAYLDEFPLTPSQRVEKHRLDRTPAGAYDDLVGRWG
jgi:crotonobetaine/carnitine-CoA ligase